MTKVQITGKHKARAKERETKNRKSKIMVALIMTQSRAGTVTKKDTHKLNVVPELEKINP
jgi:hypothetical protein